VSWSPQLSYQLDNHPFAGTQSQLVEGDRTIPIHVRGQGYLGVQLPKIRLETRRLARTMEKVVFFMEFLSAIWLERSGRVESIRPEKARYIPKAGRYSKRFSCLLILENVPIKVINYREEANPICAARVSRPVPAGLPASRPGTRDHARPAGSRSTLEIP